MYCPGLRASASGVGTVQRTDDAARHREAEAIRIAKGEYGLSRAKLGGVAPRYGREVGAFDLDDGQVRQRIGTDNLRRQDATIVQRNAYLGRALNNVVVGDNVAIRRDDDASANAVFDPRLLTLPERSLEHGAEENCCIWLLSPPS